MHLFKNLCKFSSVSQAPPVDDKQCDKQLCVMVVGLANVPSSISFVAAAKHLCKLSSFLYGIDHWSVKTLDSNSYRWVSGKPSLVD